MTEASNDRPTLREVLKQEHPDLFAVLMRQWDIAWNEWLPALGVDRQKLSFNSYPHLRNVEHHLNDILVMSDGDARHHLRLDMQPCELYVALASVLFHDIGRWEVDSDNPHGQASYELLDREHDALGFPSRELARSVGRVCRYHDPPSGETFAEVPSNCRLSTVTIDPYGSTRERLVAALLWLADRMDSTFTRVLPFYLQAGRGIHVVTAFRNAIRGARVDWTANMVCTELGDFVSSKVNNLDIIPPDKITYKPRRNNKVIDKPFTHATASVEIRKALGQGNASDTAIAQALKSWLELKEGDNGILDEPVRLAAELFPQQEHVGLQRFDAIHWLIARRMVYAEMDESVTKKAFVWPELVTVAVAMADTTRNASGLGAVGELLGAFGMPLRTWLIEVHDHLFNGWGQETYEPVFSKGYLCSVVDCMWELSTRVFGVSRMTYQNLADALFDPDVTRVRNAVRRISIATRGLAARSDGAVWAGESHWHWTCKTSMDGKCELVHRDRVRKTIGNLGEPT
jgi:hypothetical protein